MNEEKRENGAFACSVCGARFSEEKQYFGHLRIHSGAVSWSCSQCSGQTFNSQSKLRTHENACHNYARPFKCDQCDLEFDKASQLAYHQRSVHLGEKSHICQICEKGFFRKTDLRTHLNTHLETNVSICEVCGKKFNHISNLIRHSRMHNGVKPYPCTECGKRFTQINSLVRHKKIHGKTSEANGIKNCLNSMESQKLGNVAEPQPKIIRRRHYCKICGEDFKFILLLRQHQKEHADVSHISEKEHEKEIQENESVEERICEESPSVSKQKPQNHLHQIELPITHSTLSTENRNVNDNEDELNLECAADLDKISQEKILETSFCITSEQLEQLTLPEDRILELVGNINSLEMPLDRVANVNVAEILSIYNTENDDALSSENSQLKMKHRNSLDNAKDIIYVQCLPKNDSPPNGKSEMSQSKKLSKPEVLPVEIVKELPPFDSNLLIRDNSVDQDSFIHFLPRNEDVEALELDQDKSGMRLVQIETDQQFYELIMNSFTEKVSNSAISKIADIEEDIMGSAEQENQQMALQEFEFFKNDQCAYKSGTDFDNIQDDNYTEHFLEFEQSSKFQNDIGLTPDQEEENRHFFSLEESTKDKINDNVNSNSVDFAFVYAVGNVELAPEQDRVFQDVAVDDNEENSTELEKTKRKFKCNVCKKSFATRYNFKQHIGTHFVEEQKFHCRQCGLSFAWKATLNKHISKVHRPNGRQMFACHRCPKMYSTMTQMKDHVNRDHLNERNHVCTQCGKSFFKKFDLKMHYRTHSNERPYVCRSCGKGFYHRSHIIRHKRIHSGEKPYSCDVCPKSFTQKSSLKTHQRKHEKEKISSLDYDLHNEEPLSLSSL